MIRFTVVWSDPAQNRLTTIWINAPDRNAVTVATSAIDAALAIDPADKGMPVHEGLRTLLSPCSMSCSPWTKETASSELSRYARTRSQIHPPKGTGRPRPRNETT